MQLALETARASSSSLRSLALRRWPRSRLRAPSSLSLSLFRLFFLPRSSSSLRSLFLLLSALYSFYPIATNTNARLLLAHTSTEGEEIVRKRSLLNTLLSMHVNRRETAKYLAKRFASARSKRKPYQLSPPFLYYTCLVSIEIKGMAALDPTMHEFPTFLHTLAE